MPPARYHHIHRIDDERNRTHAWRVQVQRRSRIVIRLFSDGLYGGKRKAFEAATVFRDTLLKAFHDRRYGLWRRNRKRRNNTSGIVGVGRYVSCERKGGQVRARVFWLAFWDGSDGKRRQALRELVDMSARSP